MASPAAQGAEAAPDAEKQNASSSGATLGPAAAAAVAASAEATAAVATPAAADAPARETEVAPAAAAAAPDAATAAGDAATAGLVAAEEGVSADTAAAVTTPVAVAPTADGTAATPAAAAARTAGLSEEKTAAPPSRLGVKHVFSSPSAAFSVEGMSSLSSVAASTTSPTAPPRASAADSPAVTAFPAAAATPVVFTSEPDAVSGTVGKAEAAAGGPAAGAGGGAAGVTTAAAAAPLSGATTQAKAAAVTAAQQLFTFEEALAERLQALAVDGCTDELLVIEVDEEKNRLRLVAATPFSGGLLQQRFQRVAAAAPPDDPRLFLLRLDILSNTPVWLMISWTPAEVCSSWRRMYIDFAGWTLRTSLCLPRGFLYEYYTSDTKALNFAAYRNALLKGVAARREQLEHPSYGTGFAAALQASWERHMRRPRHKSLSACLEREEFEQQQDLSSAATATPPTFTPFIAVDFDEEFSLALAQFRSHQISCLEILIDDTSSTICALPCVYDTPGLLQEHAAGSSEPRYYLLRYNGIATFLLYCPEGASRHDRVLYAACKRRVWEEIACRGKVKILSRLDISSSTDISEKLLACRATEELQQETEEEQRRLALSVLQRVGSGSSSSETTAALANLLGESLVLLVSLPTKATPPGEGWADGEVLQKPRNTLSAWRAAARLVLPAGLPRDAGGIVGDKEEEGAPARDRGDADARKGKDLALEAAGKLQKRQSRDVKVEEEDWSEQWSAWDSSSDGSCEEI